MTTEDDIKSGAQEGEGDSEALEAARAEVATIEPSVGGSAEALARLEIDKITETVPSDGEDEDEEDEEPAGTPAQLGAQRFVYAAYFAGAIAVAFILSKAISYGWARLNLWKPEHIGEPNDEVAISVAAIVGALVAIYYYRDQKTRTLAEEVAAELGKVTWPSRDEVVNSTFVVIVTTFVATIFFALMDRFWSFVTNLVYGA
jgi:preprotein translocase subunit SecE